jgi:hypothetical protein
MGMPAEFEKDILNRADALLKRQARPGESDTGAFPVLTDFVEDKAATDELARDVYKRVMLQVEGHLAHDLEARLAQHLAPQIHAAVISALGDLRQELANAISEAVREAIAARNKHK